MYQSFAVRNFRCFRDLTIEPLERLNLIAGKNNVGKTSLLEALFLHLGWYNPNLPTFVNAVRGLERVEFTADSVWGWLFLGKRASELIALTGTRRDGSFERVTVQLGDPPQSFLVEGVKEEGGLPIQGVFPTTETAPRGLLIEHQDSTGGTDRVWTWVTSQGVRQSRPLNVTVPMAAFLSSHLRTAQENPAHFSKLKEKRREKDIVEAMQILEPRLKDLSILIVGGVPVVCGDIGIGQLVPLPFMGEGVVRLLSIILAIVSAPGGAVLVDEIENGLHYSVLQDVWKVVATAARKADCQVFASTHSWECIRAAHEAFSSDGVYDFRLHRLDRLNGDIRAVTYDQEALDGAITAGLEVR